MRGRERASVAVAVAAGWLLLISPPVVGKGAGGSPTGGWSDPDAGLTSLDGGERYFAYGTEGRTIALKYDREADRMQSRGLPGRLQIPGVTIDGEPAGLSGDGSLLVLSERGGWRGGGGGSSTRFVLVETDLFVKSWEIELEGAFSFDAISPDGETLYLVHYPRPRDPTRYEVRAYDVDAERLREEPILDTRTAPQVMRGMPLARQESPDGVWAYTLYDGAGDGPFVHALDTAEGTALCVELPHLEELKNPFKLTLADLEPEDPLEVVNRKGEVMALIETGSWEVTAPGHDHAEHGHPEADDGGGVSAGQILPAGAILLVPLAGLLAVRRRRRP